MVCVKSGKEKSGMKNVSAALYKSLCFIVAFLLLCVVMNVVFRKEMFTVSVLAFSAGIGYFFLLYIASDKTEFFDEIYGYCLTAFLICIGIFQRSSADFIHRRLSSLSNC